MKKKTNRKSKIVNDILSYLIIAVALLTNLVSIFFTVDMKILLNLILFLLASVTITNIIERYSILEKLLAFINLKNETTKTFISTRDKLNEYTIDDFWEDANEVDILALSSLGILTTFRETFERHLDKGVKFRFIIIDPNTQAAIDAVKYKIKGVNRRNIERHIEDGYDALTEYYNKFNNLIEYKLTDISPPCALMIVKRKNPSQNFVKVDLYSVKTSDGDRRSWIVKKDDNLNFDFFVEQFEIFWRNAYKK